MTKTTRAALALLLATGALGLGGCSFSIGTGTPTTVTSAQVEGLAEDALEQQVGIRPDIDCGGEDFPLEDGASRTCTLTDPDSGTEFDAEVVLSDVDGTQFHVDVNVATEPNN